ncbi:MAG: tyrosine--tRNA ligase [Bacteroidetes bacterium]|nr:tyrosine--tRNA ligase [Bacteroidota bacterium]
MTFIEELRSRGLIQDMMPGTEEQLLREVTAGYVGFDPTAESLHVGNLLPITLLMRFQRAGHKPLALVGGATGMIGDPSGKSAERNLLDEATLRRNCAGIEKQLRKFLDFEPGATQAEVVNNYDWFKEFSFLGFIRDVGKHISVNYMMAKDSVKKRLETGISFTEFSYQLIQGYDYYWLNRHKGVKLQMGGADQWGNITTGTELIRRMQHAQQEAVSESAENTAFALTCPLITKSDGGKFGKTESGTIWLDATRTSAYQFYQFWLKLADADAARMAYIFSFKPVSEIEALIARHEEAPHQRALQKALAEELTVMVHSEEDLHFAQQASLILFGGSAVEALRALNEQQLLEVMEGVPQVRIAQASWEAGQGLIDFLTEHKIFPSKGEARKMIAAGGLSLNKEKVTAPDFVLRKEQLLNGRYLLIQKGKSNYTLAVWE